MRRERGLSTIQHCLEWDKFELRTHSPKLNTFINRCKRIGFCNEELPQITEQFGEADDILFNRTLTTGNTRHVLQTYLPDRTETACNLRNRTHNKSLVNKTCHLNEKDFII